MILLDTHVLLWLDRDTPRLGRATRKAIDLAFNADEVAVSAVSFWEIGTLIRKDRIRLDMELQAWRNDFIRQGVTEFAVDGEIGIKASALDPFHADPADRLIAATALQNSLTLVTADKRILESGLPMKLMDAAR